MGIPSNFLNSTQYRQMAGRAGRAGIDDLGEAILLGTSDSRTQEKLRELMEVHRFVP